MKNKNFDAGLPFITSLIAIFSIITTTQSWGYVYKLFSDQLWQSLGAILGAIGVFIGAKLGSKLGYEQNIKIQNNQLKETKKSLLPLVRNEIWDNILCLQGAIDFLEQPPPNALETEQIKSMFGALELSISQIRTVHFEETVKAHILPLIDSELQTLLRGSSSSINHVCIYLKMEAYKYYCGNSNYIKFENMDNIVVLLKDCVNLLEQAIMRFDATENLNELLGY
ncbi:hypothetical protein [Paenibacillus sp. UNC451MF]|uniref:hypothetical protein n=1 Tax=Paenibacillus sp. UNC451MF TaxID=1449063 RepID=UPI00049195AB|nr:hypothetical protein [Paenibacillus sp. UNC451MF]